MIAIDMPLTKKTKGTGAYTGQSENSDWLRKEDSLVELSPKTAASDFRRERTRLLGRWMHGADVRRAGRCGHRGVPQTLDRQSSQGPGRTLGLALALASLARTQPEVAFTLAPTGRQRVRPVPEDHNKEA